ncbi:MAG: nucleoside-diphosphate kinase [Elusimicrobiota bacterium]
MERSCLIIKPDGIGKKKAGEIISRMESEGLKLLAMKMLNPSKEQIEGFYEMHKGKHFFEPFINFMLSGPIIVTAWEGKGTIAHIRKIIGATNSKEAAAGTLRKMFGTDNRKNLVHASDSPESAKREIGYFFGSQELIEYDPDAWIDK